MHGFATAVVEPVARQLPAAHAVHTERPPALKVPTGHGFALDESVPAAQNWPAGHVRQVAADVALVLVEYVPAGHCVAAAFAVPEQKVPAGQGVQADVAAPPAEKVPARQALAVPTICAARQ